MEKGKNTKAGVVWHDEDIGQTDTSLRHFLVSVDFQKHANDVHILKNTKSTKIRREKKN